MQLRYNNKHGLVEISKTCYTCIYCHDKLCPGCETNENENYVEDTVKRIELKDW